MAPMTTLLKSWGCTNSFMQQDGGSQIKKICMIFMHMFPWRADHPIVACTVIGSLSETYAGGKKWLSIKCRQKLDFFFLCNCINSLICDRAYWWDFVFNLSTRTFYGCNSFYCSSLLSQWTASFDQMIKVRCCICKTYVYWIYFIATLFLPHCAQSAVHTCALSSILSYWFVVGVATTNWKSPRVMHCF